MLVTKSGCGSTPSPVLLDQAGAVTDSGEPQNTDDHSQDRDNPPQLPHLPPFLQLAPENPDQQPNHADDDAGQEQILLASSHRTRLLMATVPINPSTTTMPTTMGQNQLGLILFPSRDRNVVRDIDAGVVQEIQESEPRAAAQPGDEYKHRDDSGAPPEAFLAGLEADDREDRECDGDDEYQNFHLLPMVCQCDNARIANVTPRPRHSMVPGHLWFSRSTRLAE